MVVPTEVYQTVFTMTVTLNRASLNIDSEVGGYTGLLIVGASSTTARPPLRVATCALWKPKRLVLGLDYPNVLDVGPLCSTQNMRENFGLGGVLY